ncbi:unnamed protein product [Symbiodinium necroappetens]|uniref:Uncharacterized protein n=1 Tax=Symbiodinium necroappetens TaxID=1628268 RepID=A0A812WJW1_9DINO|nr:unnamed protein product [Symbiodinium necroappetens]
MEFDIVSMSEANQEYRRLCMANTNPEHVKHMFGSIEDQCRAHSPCLLCHERGQQCNVRELCESEGVDLLVAGSPCDPFSKMRAKRFACGTLKQHVSYGITMDAMVESFLCHKPKVAIMEQVGLHSGSADAAEAAAEAQHGQCIVLPVTCKTPLAIESFLSSLGIAAPAESVTHAKVLQTEVEVMLVYGLESSGNNQSETEHSGSAGRARATCITCRIPTCLQAVDKTTAVNQRACIFETLNQLPEWTRLASNFKVKCRQSTCDRYSANRLTEDGLMCEGYHMQDWMLLNLSSGTTAASEHVEAMQWLGLIQGHHGLFTRLMQVYLGSPAQPPVQAPPPQEADAPVAVATTDNDDEDFFASWGAALDLELQAAGPREQPETGAVPVANADMDGNKGPVDPAQAADAKDEHEAWLEMKRKRRQTAEAFALSDPLPRLSVMHEATSFMLLEAARGTDVTSVFKEFLQILWSDPKAIMAEKCGEREAAFRTKPSNWWLRT